MVHAQGGERHHLNACFFFRAWRNIQAEMRLDESVCMLNLSFQTMVRALTIPTTMQSSFDARQPAVAVDKPHLLSQGHRVLRLPRAVSRSPAASPGVARSPAVGQVSCPEARPCCCCCCCSCERQAIESEKESGKEKAKPVETPTRNDLQPRLKTIKSCCA